MTVTEVVNRCEGILAVYSITGMQWFYAVLIGVALSLAIGWTAQFLPVVPLLRSVGAFMVALALGNVSVLVWWTRRQPGAGYYGFGLDNVVYLAIAFVVAAVLHSILGRLGTVWTPALGSSTAPSSWVVLARCGEPSGPCGP